MELKKCSQCGENVCEDFITRGSCGDIDPNIRNLMNDVINARGSVSAIWQDIRNEFPTVKWRVRNYRSALTDKYK